MFIKEYVSCADLGVYIYNVDVLELVRFTCFFFFQAEDGIRDLTVTGVQTCALPILRTRSRTSSAARPPSSRTSSALSLVRTEVDAGVALVTLDDPGRRNALSLDMVAEIVSAFDALEGDGSVGAVVVTGAPPAFCAGADLSHLGQAGQGSEGGGLRSVYEGFLRVQRSPLPTVAAVNGAAVGAGVN